MSYETQKIDKESTIEAKLIIASIRMHAGIMNHSMVYDRHDQAIV